MADITSTGYNHYKSGTLSPAGATGRAGNLSDDNLATYAQSYTSAAIDFGSGNGKLVENFRCAVHNSTARTNLLGKYFQGSNDSTNGADGAWTTLITFSAENFGTPASYPGFGSWITIGSPDVYRWYRLTGDGTANGVVNEWEMEVPIEEAVEDARLYLSSLGTEIEQLRVLLATISGIQTEVLRLYLSSMVRDRESLCLYLSTSSALLQYLRLFLSTTDGTVVDALQLFLSATDGVQMETLKLHLSALRQPPSFRSVVAQRLTSIMHEVA